MDCHWFVLSFWEQREACKKGKFFWVIKKKPLAAEREWGWRGGSGDVAGAGSAAGLWLRCVPKNTPAGKRLFLAVET